MRPRLTGMTAWLAVGTTLAVVISCGLGTYIYSIHHYQTLLDTARNTALAQSDLIRAAVEHQMIEHDRTLIGEMIQRFGKERNVRAVVLLDRKGQARYSSIPLEPNDDLSIGSPTCQACHRYPPEERGSSRVITTRRGTTLRTVEPIRNREACWGCHGPGQKINGILIVDIDAGEIRAAMNRDLRWLAAGSGALMLILIGAIGGLFRVTVVRRLKGFETTARLIAAGDIERRVPARGSDTVDWLAREFNTMADSVMGLLAQIRDQRERLERVINGIDDGIVVLDSDRQVIAANDAFLGRTGQTRETVFGSSCRCVTPGAYGPGDCPTLACLRSGERQVRICERRAEGGAVRWEEVHASPILGPTGSVVQVVEVWRDISQRRAAEAQLAESHRLASLGMLASGFSHELNTPLATALTSIEGILRGAPADDGTQRDRILENARTAREQILRCGGITQHFLHLASGKASPTDIVEIAPALDAVARLLAPTARAHGVTIEVAPVAAGIRVRVNDAELQHVLLNLSLNAIQACERGGRVRLDAVAGDPVRVRVQDGGCGIAPDDLRKIFEPFFGLRKGGTGLGLFLSLNFARQWGGDIRVASTPGEGSTFEVTLPPLAADAEREAGL